jgi:SHS2 domain-containing protein
VKKFTIIPHTADVGLDVYGTTMAELFENAADGMFSFLGTPAGDFPAAQRTLEINGFDNETLLVNWLNQLLYLHAVEKLFPVAFHVLELRPGFLKVRIDAKKITGCTPQLREIKAATYHALSLQRTVAGFMTTIIFDV